MEDFPKKIKSGDAAIVLMTPSKVKEYVLYQAFMKHYVLFKILDEKRGRYQFKILFITCRSQLCGLSFEFLKKF